MDRAPGPGETEPRSRAGDSIESTLTLTLSRVRQPSPGGGPGADGRRRSHLQKFQTYATLIRGSPGEARLSTFGRIIADARKALGMSQKDLAARTCKEGGDAISPQYLNDIEHNRRNPPSEFIIGQLASHLGLSKEHLIAAAGLWPTDLREKLPQSDPEQIEKAFTAFRRALKDKR